MGFFGHLIGTVGPGKNGQPIRAHSRTLIHPKWAGSEFFFAAQKQMSDQTIQARNHQALFLNAPIFLNSSVYPIIIIIKQNTQAYEFSHEMVRFRVNSETSDAFQTEPLVSGVTKHEVVCYFIFHFDWWWVTVFNCQFSSSSIYATSPQLRFQQLSSAHRRVR